MNDEHFSRLERMYLAAPCNEYYRPRIKVGDGTAEVILPIGPQLFHSAGAAHGAVYFKGIDDAAFFAANSLVEDVFVLTVNLNVYLSRPVTAGELRAVGRVVTRTKSLITAEAILTNDAGAEVGRGTGLFALSRIALGTAQGYG